MGRDVLGDQSSGACLWISHSSWSILYCFNFVLGPIPLSCKIGKETNGSRLRLNEQFTEQKNILV